MTQQLHLNVFANKKLSVRYKLPLKIYTMVGSGPNFSGGLDTDAELFLRGVGHLSGQSQCWIQIRVKLVITIL